MTSTVTLFHILNQILVHFIIYSVFSVTKFILILTIDSIIRLKEIFILYSNEILLLSTENSSNRMNLFLISELVIFDIQKSKFGILFQHRVIEFSCKPIEIEKAQTV